MPPNGGLGTVFPVNLYKFSLCYNGTLVIYNTVLCCVINGTGYQIGIGSVTVTRITQNCNTTFDSFLSFDKLVLSLTRRLVVTYFSFISFFNQVVLSRTPNNGI